MDVLGAAELAEEVRREGHWVEEWWFVHCGLVLCVWMEERGDLKSIVVFKERRALEDVLGLRGG